MIDITLQLMLYRWSIALFTKEKKMRGQKFNVGDIVEWEHSDTAQPFIGLITSLNKKEKEVTIHWFFNVVSSVS